MPYAYILLHSAYVLIVGKTLSEQDMDISKHMPKA